MCERVTAGKCNAVTGVLAHLSIPEIPVLHAAIDDKLTMERIHKLTEDIWSS